MLTRRDAFGVGEVKIPDACFCLRGDFGRRGARRKQRERGAHNRKQRTKASESSDGAEHEQKHVLEFSCVLDQQLKKKALQPWPAAATGTPDCVYNHEVCGFVDHVVHVLFGFGQQ